MNDINQEISKCLFCDSPLCKAKIKNVGCPLGVDIPQILAYLKEDNYEEAYQCLIENNPFPEFTSALCNSYCGQSCVMGINFPDIEKDIIEKAFENGYVKTRKVRKRKEKVAIIGSGPSGLSAAYYLNKEGYNVTIYEKNDRYGGNLMYGITNERLDKEIVFRRISLMMEDGIIFINNFHEDLRQIDCDMMILATGLLPKQLKVTGSQFRSVIYARDYLTTNTKKLLDYSISDDLAKGKVVLIAGCGKSGAEVLSICMKQQARRIAMIDYRDMPPMHRTNFFPEYSNAINYPKSIMDSRKITGMDPRGYNVTIGEIAGDVDVRQVKTVGVTWKESEGVMLPSLDSKTEQVYSVDLIIVAMGYDTVDSSVLENLRIEKKGRYLDVKNYQTSNKTIYACGDVKNGPTNVCEAIKDGMLCALSIIK